MEGRKSKGRLFKRVSFRYLSVERSVVLLDIADAIKLGEVVNESNTKT